PDAALAAGSPITKPGGSSFRELTSLKRQRTRPFMASISGQPRADKNLRQPHAEETIHAGMGPMPHSQGTAFRLWAPHADAVHIVGDFNDWDPQAARMTKEENGNWYLNVPQAKVGDEYRYLLKCGEKEVSRMDPRA